MKFNFRIVVAASVFLFLLLYSLEAQTVNKIPPKEASLISHLVKEARQPGSHAKGDVYLLIRIGKIEYIAELKSGRVVSQRKAKFPARAICGDYAEVGTNLMNKNKKETAQGAGQILKISNGKWKMIALAEGDYSCDSLKGISQSVMNCLNVECF